MIHLRPVQGLDLPELAPYRTMKRQQEQRDQGIFVAEGEKVVRRLLESDFEVVSLLLPEDWLTRYSDLLAKRPEKEIDAFTVDRKVLEELTGYSFYQGVLAVGRVPPPPLLDEVLQRTARPRLFVAVDGISNAANLGGLIRNCTAFGVHALVVGESCCSPYLRRSVRSSMGAIFKLPIIEAANLARSIEQIKNAGLQAVAAHARADERSLSKAHFTEDCVIVLGNEEHGISPAVLALCNEQVVIPMQNEVDSLNVGTAGAIFLYEVSRQRGMA